MIQVPYEKEYKDVKDLSDRDIFLLILEELKAVNYYLDTMYTENTMNKGD